MTAIKVKRPAPADGATERVNAEQATPVDFPRNAVDALKQLVEEKGETLASREEKELLRITREVILRVHEDSPEIFGNPSDTLSGDVLTAQVYLIGFIAQALRQGEQEQVKAAFGHLQTLEQYWEFRASVGDKAKLKFPQEFVESLFRIKNVSGNLAHDSQVKKIESDLSGQKELGLYKAVRKRYGLGEQEREGVIDVVSYLDAVAEFASNRFQGVATVTEAQLHVYAFMAHLLAPLNPEEIFETLAYEATPELPANDERIRTLVRHAPELSDGRVLFYLARIIDYYRLVTYLDTTGEQLSQLPRFREFIKKMAAKGTDGLWLLYSGLADKSIKACIGNEQCLRKGLEVGMGRLTDSLYRFVSEGEVIENEGDLTESGEVLFEDWFWVQLALEMPSLLMGGRKFTIHWNAHMEGENGKERRTFGCVFCKAFEKVAETIKMSFFNLRRVKDKERLKRFIIEVWKLMVQKKEKGEEGMSFDRLPTIVEMANGLTV